jgi:CelD/BcsL family acetyltransferase involved in cellulose biosynthesis
MLAPAQTRLAAERRPLAALGDIVAPWRDLAARAAEPNVFYDPDFALAAAGAPTLGCGVEAILVWSADQPRRLLGLFPFSISRRRYALKLPLLVGWTHPFAPLGTPLVDRDACAEVVAAFLDHVVGDEALPKHMLLPLLNENGPVAGALQSALAAAGGACAVFGRHRRAVLQPGRDRGGYIKRAVGVKRRKELRRQRRRLAEIGQLSFTVASAPDEVATALADFLGLEASGWKGHAGTAMAQDADVRRFVETAIGALASRGAARGARLSCGSRPIACVLALVSGNVAWSWKVAYDENFAAFSPGVQAFLDLTEALLADDRLACVDSCAVENHPMIDHLWRERLSLGDCLIGLQGGPRFALACRLEGARHKLYGLARQLRDATVIASRTRSNPRAAA